jgi:hypothetical protein
MYDGTIDDLHALDQLKLAREMHRIDAGVVVTTAGRASNAFEARREELERELGIDIRAIARDEFVQIVMTRLGSDRGF